jgi:hypothetical protein
MNSVEKNEELFRFRFAYDGIMMWPFIRYFIMERAIIKMLDLNVPQSCEEKLSFKDILKYGLFTVFNNPYIHDAGKGGVMIFSTGSVNIKTQNGSFQNRLYDHFASLYPDKTVIIEDSFKRRYYTPRVFRNVRYHDYVHMMASIKSRIFPLSRIDLSTIGDFLVFLKRNFPYDLPDSEWEASREILYKISGRLCFCHKYYSRLFKKLKPKLLIIENGCYGSRGYIFKWAKDFGIVTCEIQHAIVSKNHPAYNYGNYPTAREYRSYMPDYFLSYGDYWNQRVSIPSDIVTIGNPNLTESLKRRARDTALAGFHRTVLVISSGNLPELTVKTVMDLRNKLDPDSFRIVFRPNPEEISICDTRYKILKENNISFDRGDLYDSLSKAEFLIATDLSTVLFESLAFDIPVYLFRSNWVEHNLSETAFFNLFTDTDQVVDRIKAGSGRREIDVNGLWNPGWEENYRRFLNNVVGLR